MSIAHVLVAIDASPFGVELLRYARQVAAAQHASVTAVYAVTSALMATPAVALDGGMGIASLAEIDEQELQRAREAVAQEARTEGPALNWLSDRGGPCYRLMQRAAWTADLVVMARHDTRQATVGWVPPDLVETTALDAGRPVLVVPARQTATRWVQPRRVLLAWKPTREAARAATAALPWLRTAERIDLVARAAREPMEPGWPGSEQVTAWLRSQGCAGRIEVRDPNGADDTRLGESLLDWAESGDADWLVMGCYGHSRARERLLGGVTRTVLQQMDRPVLMVH